MWMTVASSAEFPFRNTTSARLEYVEALGPPTIRPVGILLSVLENIY